MHTPQCSLKHYLRQTGHGSNLNAPSTDEWIKMEGCIYTMYSIPSHLAIKMNDIMTATWMDLEMITLRQGQLPYMWNLKTWFK